MLFMHSFMQDATSWIMASPETEANSAQLPLFLDLADKGYSVWMGNNRGTRYSNKNDAKFSGADVPTYHRYKLMNYRKYDFTWDVMGTSDLPAFLNKITELNGNKKVTYVGYGQGNSQMFYGLAKNEQYFASKVDKAIMLAPSLYYSQQAPLESYEGIYGLWRLEGLNMLA